jgi:2-methylisocitrate lyase-like PEP mutase family enzyme
VASQLEKAERFRSLHELEGAFVIPNPWDAGSARLLAGMGFEALATTSSGFALSLGRRDGGVSREEKLEHCRALCRATDLPVSADLEKGFADHPEGVAETIKLVAETGVVGGSIEDFTGDESDPIFGFDLALERVQAAVEAARSVAFPFVLTARAENLLHGSGDLDDTIRRLQAFEAVGADVLFAPGLKTLEDVRTVTGAVRRPVNVIGPMVRGATVKELEDAGAKRISVGGALAYTALGNLVRAADDLREGSLEWTSAVPAMREEIKRLLGNTGPDSGK